MKHAPQLSRSQFMVGLLVVLTIACIPRLYRINNPILDFNQWRMGTTASLARNFYRHGMNFFQPRIDGFGPEKLWIEEMPTYPYLVALTYFITGEQVVVGRIWSVIFGLLAIVMVALIGKLWMGDWAGMTAGLAMALSPLGAYVDRSFQRQSLTIFLMLVAVYCADRWLRTPARRWFGFAALAGGIAIPTNPPVIYMGFVLIGVMVTRLGWKFLLHRQPWLLAGAMLLPMVVWMWWALLNGSANWGGSRYYVPFFRDFHNPDYFTRWLVGPHAQAWRLQVFHLLGWQLLTPGFMLLAVIGILAGVFYRSWLPLWWAGCGLLYFILDSFVIFIPHNYFYPVILPGFALLAGAGTALLLSGPGIWRWIGAGTALLVWVSVPLWSYDLSLGNWRSHAWGQMFQPDDVHHPQPISAYYDWHDFAHWLDLADDVQQLVPPDALIIVDSPVESLFYYCDRPGRVQTLGDYWFNIKRLEEFRQQEQCQFLIIQNLPYWRSEIGGLHPEQHRVVESLYRYVSNHYECLLSRDRWEIYDLRNFDPGPWQALIEDMQAVIAPDERVFVDSCNQLLLELAQRNGTAGCMTEVGFHVEQIERKAQKEEYAFFVVTDVPAFRSTLPGVNTEMFIYMSTRYRPIVEKPEWIIYDLRRLIPGAQRFVLPEDATPGA